jgi:hypothetical protein
LELDDFPDGVKVNHQDFDNVVWEEASRAVGAMIRKRGIEEVIIQMDICKVHNSVKIMRRLEEFQVTRLSVHHILPIFHLAASGLPPGARPQIP